MRLPDISTVTGLVQWGLITAVVLFILNVLFESNVRHFLEEHGWDQLLSRAIRKMRPLTERRGFWFAFGLVGGAAAIAWALPITAPTAIPPNPTQVKALTDERDQLRQKVTEQTAQINSYREIMSTLREQGKGAIPSGFLNLSDARRWQLVTALHDTSRISETTKCLVLVWGKPNSSTATVFWEQFRPILFYSGWYINGGTVMTARDFFPKGITVSVGTDKGDAFNCAFHLKEFIESLNVEPVQLKTNQVSPELVASHNTAVELMIGDVTKR